MQTVREEKKKWVASPVNIQMGLAELVAPWCGLTLLALAVPVQSVPKLYSFIIIFQAKTKNGNKNQINYNCKEINNLKKQEKKKKDRKCLRRRLFSLSLSSRRWHAFQQCALPR
jgi:hypothetical protein